MAIISISHFLCALAYLGLLGLLALRWRPTLASWLLVVACGVTVLWAAGIGLAAAGGSANRGLLVGLEAVHYGAWYAFLLAQIFDDAGVDRQPRYRLWVLTTVTAAVPVMVLGLALFASGVPTEEAGSQYDPTLLGALLLPVGALVLLENVFRNADGERRWALRFLVAGLGVAFAFDVVVFADAVLFGFLDVRLLAARGLVHILAVPLIAVTAARSRQWAPAIHVSRRVVFHSATLLITGLFLLVLAAAGYYVRSFGGDWASAVLITLLVAAAVGFLLIILSGRYRAAFQRFLSSHFYSLRYDYREEWLRFIGNLGDQHAAPLDERLVRAVADVFEVPEGQLWLLKDGVFALQTSWNMPPVEGAEAKDSPFITHLATRTGVIELPTTPADGMPAPPWLAAIRRPWLIVPLQRGGELLGFIVLGRARDGRRLQAEDHELLDILARQAASYLAEWLSQQELMQARRFDAFNRQVTYIAHDLKNLASQLSLIVANARRFRDNPAFVDDMIQTVTDSVGTMERLLAQVGRERAAGGETAADVVPLTPVVAQVLRRFAHGLPCPVLEGGDEGAAVRVDRRRLMTVLGNLVQNAVDAAGRDGTVRLRLARDNGFAAVAVQDDGPGMERAFVENELFRPFRTTKGAGYGIGAFEAREFARQHGGRLDVETAPGKGTVMRLVLPLATSDAAERYRAETPA